jgi:NADH:ubiquinone oxidoreductase subunit 2 (subunit N)
VQANLVGLAIFAVLNSIVALYYYLVVIKVMYVDHSPDEDKAIPVSQTYVWVLGAAALIVVLLGTFFATPIFEWATRGASSLFGVGV